MSTEEKTNGEHILDIAAMKYFNRPSWDIELAAMLPIGFKEVLTAEIDKRLWELSKTVAFNIANKQG